QVDAPVIAELMVGRCIERRGSAASSAGVLHSSCARGLIRDSPRRHAELAVDREISPEEVTAMRLRLLPRARDGDGADHAGSGPVVAPATCGASGEAHLKVT